MLAFDRWHRAEALEQQRDLAVAVRMANTEVRDWRRYLESLVLPPEDLDQPQEAPADRLVRQLARLVPMQE